MAARSGAGTGVVVSLVVFVICTVAMLVLTIVFYSKYNEAIENQNKAENALNQFASNEVRNRDDVKAMMAEAGTRSVVGYLLDQRRTLMTNVTGNPETRLDQVTFEFRPYGVRENESLRAFAARSQSELNAARGELEAKNRQLAQMEELVRQKDQQLAAATRARNEAVEEVSGRIQTYATSVDQYKTQVDSTISAVNQTIQNQQAVHARSRAELESLLDDARRQVAMRDGRLAQFEEAFNRTRLLAPDPSRLVDAHVLENPRGNTLFIDRGQQDKIVLGMTFEVYDNAASLTPDRVTGELPRGKASIEIVNVGPSTSTGIITRQTAGRPVVRGDVIANAVYDPERTYTFLVHGVFDINGDGLPTASEADDIRRLIRSWGGTIIEGDELRGDLDFLILGVQPPKPGPLPSAPPDHVLRDWMNRNAAWAKYDELFRQATDAKIPVLNANRFFTLIGYVQR